MNKQANSGRRCRAILAFLLALSLTACTNSTPQPAEEPSEQESAQEGAVESENPAEASRASGTYTGTAQGHNGELTVSVTLEDGSIVSVEVTDHMETDGVSDQALSLIPESIVRAQSTAVDTVSGATATSTAIIEATGAALEEAGVDPASLVGAVEATPLSFTPGTYKGSAYGKWGEKSVEGFRFDSPRDIKPIEVEVVVDETSIVSVSVLHCDDTPGYVEPVSEQIPAAIVAHQSIGVDVVTGCTMTSNGIINAVSQALEEAGGDLVALNRKVPRSTEHTAYTADVVIVGAGGAGSAAALAATEAGKSVVILEKTGKVGGMSVMTTGFIGVESEIAKEAGDYRTLDEVYEEFMDYNQWTANSLIVRSILELSGDTAQWLADHGYELRVGNGITHDTGKGSAKIQNLYDSYILKDAGNTLLLSTAAQELMIEDGKVVGVTGQHTDGSTVEVRADAVILATGGFGGNKEMQREYFGTDRYWLSGLNASTGDGINMALSAGARMGDEVYPHITEFAANADVNFNDYYFKYLNYTGLLMLDTQGYRFMNEEYCVTQPLAKGASAIRQAGSFYVIFDQNSYDTIKAEGFKGFFEEETAEMLIQEHNWRSRALDPFGELMDIEMERCIEADAGWKADSIEALGKAIGFTDDVFVNEVTRYQELIAAGEDADFGKNPLFLIPLEEGPFYAVRMEPAIFGTLGGIRVDQFMRALDSDLQPIDGLYVAGQDAGGMYGYPYYETPGVTQGFAYNSGRIAGTQAAAYIG